MYEKIYYVVSGRVQGVCFRAYTQSAAVELDVTGWVRNRRDGRVEGEAWAAAEAMEKFIQWLHRGPPHGKVDHVAVEPGGHHGERPESFNIKY